MLIDPELSGISIVLVGNFNPPIFTPSWFGRYDLLPPAEVDAAELAIAHPQVTQFNTDRLNFSVEPNKLSATSTFVPFVWLHDLIVRMFRELLPHTPVSKLGINRDVHYAVESMEVRDRIGHTLAPPSAWGEWAPCIQSGKLERHGGMTTLIMQQRDLSDRPKGFVQATVQPSVKVKDGRGIFVQVNDDYELENAESVTGSEKIIELLELNFDASITRSEWIINQVMKIERS